MRRVPQTAAPGPERNVPLGRFAQPGSTSLASCLGQPEANDNRAAQKPVALRSRRGQANRGSGGPIPVGEELERFITELGRLVADLWFAGKFDARSSPEDISKSDD